VSIYFKLTFNLFIGRQSSSFTTEATVATLADFNAVLTQANAEVDIITQKLQTASSNMTSAEEDQALAGTTALKDRLVALGSGAPPTP